MVNDRINILSISSFSYNAKILSNSYWWQVSSKCAAYVYYLHISLGGSGNNRGRWYVAFSCIIKFYKVFIITEISMHTQVLTFIWREVDLRRIKLNEFSHFIELNFDGFQLHWQDPPLLFTRVLLNNTILMFAMHIVRCYT